MESKKTEIRVFHPKPRYYHTKTGSINSPLEMSQTPVPLRLLIDKELIGAVIGPRKSTIIQISRNSKTRIFFDGHREVSDTNISEVGLAIYGKPSDCSNVCHIMLEILQKRLKKLNHKGSMTLKILVPRCYIGRIIGMGCNIINTIMSNTETKIFFSDVYDKSIPDRIIIIQGSVENICKAEVEISKTMRQSFTNDPHSKAPQYTINPELNNVKSTYPGPNYPGHIFQTNYPTIPPVQYFPPYPSETYLFPAPIMQLHTNINPRFPIHEQPFSPVQLISSYTNVTDPFLPTNVYNFQAQTVVNPYLHMMDSTNINHSPHVFQLNHLPFPPVQNLPSCATVTNPFLDFNRLQESVYLFIPAFSIKSLVGILGSNINDISDESDASIQILPRIVDNPIAPHQLCHRVHVVGTRKAQWKAQEMIFDTMWKEGFGPAPEEVILTVEISVPRTQIHRIIDQYGLLNSEIEKEFGCIIRLPTNQTTYNSKYFPVYIIGGFIGTQLAQKKIRSILASNV